MQRVVLLSFDKETNCISFRHYSIMAQPCGVTKSVKALVGRRQLPDLGNLQDVSDYLIKSGYGSVSPSHFPIPLVNNNLAYRILWLSPIAYCSSWQIDQACKSSQAQMRIEGGVYTGFLKPLVPEKVDLLCCLKQNPILLYSLSSPAD